MKRWRKGEVQCRCSRENAGEDDENARKSFLARVESLR